MDAYEKLKILSAAARYDVACTSSGVDRVSDGNGIGSAAACGICHSFAGDGRCISLLKILMSNACTYDCAYCVNRVGNDIPRATFTPKEIADITINFYRRNYIEGLFLSSGVLGNPSRTTELMVEALRILREEYKFYGYIHAKVIPGTDKEAIDKLGYYCDRMSINIELPSNESLKLLAPSKSKESIFEPMGYVKNRIESTGRELALYKSAPKFTPAGQSTQMIIGASPESDLAILRLTEGLYKKYRLKRVFFSAYIPVVENTNLPALNIKPPLLRENRLYQADWLMRVYGFKSSEILDENNPTFNPYLDPKCNWAVNHPECFPVEINKATYEELIRVPGIGVISAKKIVKARRSTALSFLDLKKLGVVLKRAQYFILCSSKPAEGIKLDQSAILNALLSKAAIERLQDSAYCSQITMFESSVPDEELRKCITGQL